MLKSEAFRHPLLEEMLAVVKGYRGTSLDKAAHQRSGKELGDGEDNRYYRWGESLQAHFSSIPWQVLVVLLTLVDVGILVYGLITDDSTTTMDAATWGILGVFGVELTLKMIFFGAYLLCDIFFIVDAVVVFGSILFMALGSAGRILVIGRLLRAFRVLIKLQSLTKHVRGKLFASGFTSPLEQSLEVLRAIRATGRLSREEVRALDRVIDVMVFGQVFWCIGVLFLKSNSSVFRR